MTIRIFIIIAGIGIIFRSNICRKLLVAYAFFAVATVFLKHPYTSFINVYDIMMSTGATPPSMYTEVPSLIYQTYIVACIKTICTWIVATYFLTREDIKRKFGENAHETSPNKKN